MGNWSLAGALNLILLLPFASGVIGVSTNIQFASNR